MAVPDPASGRPPSADAGCAVRVDADLPAEALRCIPSRFRYEAPRSLDEAIALLRDGGGEAKVLAGGQSLVPLLKLRFASPELLVDINNLPDLDYHRVDDDGALHIGALCRHADLEHSALLPGSSPP